MTREKLKSIFDALRNDPQHHLGLGDIRLTIAQQDAILDLFPFKDNPLPPAEGAEAILHRHIDKQSMDELSVNVWPDMLEAMTEFAAQPHPTAEGAEENRNRIDGLIKKHISIDTANFEFCAKNNTINGSLLQGIRDVVNEFATLHAQRIAEKMKDANQFILDIARVFGIETDGVGFDGLTLSIDDFKEAAEKMVEEKLREELARFWAYQNAMGVGDDIYSFIETYLNERR